MKKIAILGSTGSIGVNTLKVVSRHRERFRVVALSCDSNYGLLARQAKAFRPKMVALGSASGVKGFKKAVAPLRPRVFCGPDGLSEMVKSSDADIVMVAVAGNASLMPLVSAIRSGKDVALASKEPLVSAGEIVTALAARKGVSILPVDSEQSAIFQCLRGREPRELKKIFLTGTGGPLRSVRASLFDGMSRSRILAHPKWSMGRKISVDSATLMNKGLEVIEARWLFNAPARRIEVVIHPEAIVHSMVEFVDGSILAQMAVPDMRLPIQYALGFPERLNSSALRMDPGGLGHLTFHKPDLKRFPCLSLAYEALRRGDTYPAALNAANEEAVGMYLSGKLKFTAIPKVIENVLAAHRAKKDCTLKDILEVDRWAREGVRRGG